MGEAGPEAIMPLTRTPSGDLGVRTQGGGGMAVVEISIHNESGQPMQVQSARVGGDLNRQVIDIVIDGLHRNVGGLRDALGGA